MAHMSKRIFRNQTKLIVTRRADSEQNRQLTQNTVNNNLKMENSFMHKKKQICISQNKETPI